MRKIIASLDIGSNTTKLIVGEYIKNTLNVLCVSEVPSNGMKKGLIINKEEAIISLKETFHKAEEVIGIPIKEVVLSVPPYYLEASISEGVSTITNPSGVITNQDIIRCMQAASYNKIDVDKELITILPTTFKINENEIVKNPLNLLAQKLSVKAVLITTSKTMVTDFLNVIESIGVKVIDVVASSLGDYYANRKKGMGNQVGAIINIGEDLTTVSIFNKGILTRAEVIDLGGKNIDNDIAYIYKITKKDARELKENLGLATANMASNEEKKVITDRVGEKTIINQRELSEIIESRLTEIIELAKKQINLLTRKNIDYIIITGGTSEIADFNILLDKLFTKNYILGKIESVGVRNNKYATAFGIIKYYNSRLILKNISYSVFSAEELETISGIHKKVNINENSILGKLFGYFFDS